MSRAAGLALFLGSLAIASAFYDDSLARNKFMALSAAAYSDRPANCLANAFSNAELKQQVTVNCDVFKGDSCSGFTAVSHGDQAIIIAFRGSSGLLQLLSEGGDAIFEKKTASIIGGAVNGYFYDAFNDIWVSGMKNDFLSLKNTYPSYKIWIAGHSLGGSMATICASTIIGMNYVQANNVYLYTMGQPRTGDSKYAAAHDALNFAAVYRITHKRDMVPHVPPEGFLDYIHHRNEVWYNDDMTIGADYVECDAEESNDCSDNDLITLSIDDHLHYFDRDISDYGNSGCIGSFSQYFGKLKEKDFEKVHHDTVEVKKVDH